MDLFRKYKKECPYCRFYSLDPELVKEHIKRMHTNEDEIYKNAIEIYDQLLIIKNSDAATWSNKGSALVLLKKYDEAMECFDKALDLNPKRLPSRVNKAICLGLLGRKEDSSGDFDYAKCLMLNFE
jgi:tetratricopeptide (TPR) repeat protein